MVLTYQWDGLPEAIIGDGSSVETDGIVCCTDGSQIDDSPVGYRIIIKTKVVEVTDNGQLGIDATVYQGEVFAVDQAAAILLQQPGVACSV